MQQKRSAYRPARKRQLQLYMAYTRMIVTTDARGQDMKGVEDREWIHTARSDLDWDYTVDGPVEDEDAAGGFTWSCSATWISPGLSMKLLQLAM